ncbi:cell cycle progression protein 1-like [Sinocyclocheilus rhinocerous]|uniref:cell cycle progression protein 1-like n=1 Tax=Sinocyclocheilus rhinocerous TaxID=307959 RepID=UPI0007B9CB18|nr:PREDICTED: cell cycle progression protein 1-like [Sinocyclocheilus rhinocerous]
MSDSSSDTESSCGWTVISNEGSDIENLGPDYAGECEDGAVIHALDVPDAKQGEESLGESSLDLTLREEAEPAQEAGGEEHVILCSSSENSDIITLADSQEAEIDAWEEPVAKEAEEEAGSEELYLGSSSSSQYTFRESETTDWCWSRWGFSRTLWEYGSHLHSSLSLSVFPADQPVQRDGGNSSSEDEEGEVKASPVVRRRRVRRSTAGSEPGDPQEPHRRQEEVLRLKTTHHSSIYSIQIRYISDMNIN